ncbi:MAG TPA: hypothetical protein VGX21_03240 [Methylomirabilota bacterium]|nr:hypothetical protein [Methylomirabilota bacterium]
MKVILHYRAPVYVEVDTTAGAVTRVWVDDEAVESTAGLTNPGPQRSVPDAEQRRARAIAESAEWPGWEFGA